MITFMDSFDHYTTNAQAAAQMDGHVSCRARGLRQLQRVGVGARAFSLGTGQVNLLCGPRLSVREHDHWPFALSHVRKRAVLRWILRETVSNDPSVRVRVQTDGNIQVQRWSGTAWEQIGITYHNAGCGRNLVQSHHCR